MKPRPQALRRRTLLAAPAALGALTRTTRAASGRPTLRVAPDGSFDIETPQVSLRGAYPSLNDVPLRPLGIKVQPSGEGGTVTYTLREGTLTLRLGSDADSVWIEAQLDGVAVAPHWINPLGGARVEGADRFFRQGLGFGGPSGLFLLPRARANHDANHLTDSAFSHDSFLTAALVAPGGGSLVLGALVHRDYLQRTTIRNHVHRRELVDKKPAGDEIVVDAGFATERIPLPGKSVHLPRLHVMSAGQPFEALGLLARKMARANDVKLRPPRLHWDSWYEFYEGHDQARLEDTLAGLASTRPPIPFQSVLIDAGFAPAGEWLVADQRLYPGGLEATFARIKAAGHTPGLWIAPFMVSSLSRVYKEHPDWVVHGLDGKPVLHGKGKPFFYVYATHEERYYLDTTHPAAFAYLRDTMRTLRKWGVKAYKVDFMEWGFKDATTIRRHTPGQTSVQHYVQVVKMLREEMGPDAYFLGCITPFAPMLGFADGMRVGYDVDTDTWNKDGNTLNMFRETMATQYMNGVLWQNDPDVQYFRDGTGTTRMSDDEAHAVALWGGILGGVVSTSDRPHRLAPDRLQLLRFVQPGTRGGYATFPLAFAPDHQILAPVRAYPDRGAFAVLFVNPGEADVDETFTLSALTGERAAFAYRWRPGAAERVGRVETLKVKLARHQSALYWLCRKDVPPAPDLGLCGEPIAGLGPLR